LGWDVYHKRDSRADEREVKEEDEVEVIGELKRELKSPDYSFRLFDKRKFFVEVKRPSVNVESNINAAFQLRRYAWSADLPISILTDFEEFSVYYCLTRPSKDDKAARSRLLYARYEEYSERWHEIAALFSKDAVSKGSLDAYVQSIPYKKGTKRVDTALLDDISEWRKNLATSIAKNNKSLSQKDLNFAVQMIIDRILFLRICEDRAIEPYDKLKQTAEGNGIYNNLGYLFKEADQKYNSGIFHFEEERGRNEPPDSITMNLKIEDGLLRDLILNLYYPYSPYVFSKIPAEILGQVYEQFLGKIIQLEENRKVEIEHKPEVRKAGGVYYTPSYIVEYIVKNTVGKLLEGKTPRAASNMKILDPACGSGSFLIGAYQCLLDWHKDWYIKNLAPIIDQGKSWTSQEILKLLPLDVEKPERSKSKKIWARTTEALRPIEKVNGNEWRLTTSERKRILINNIFGVDIDTQAVEVTKLSLLLKVLEGETEATISNLHRYFKERALPDLGNNIKCGNSLIGWDILENNPGMEQGEIKRVNPFEWNSEFPEIMQNGGFDAVIGNPPYGAEFSNYIQEYMESQYYTFVNRGESYLVFVERAVRLLKQDGILGYILPDTYLNLGFTQSLRTFLLKNTRLQEIVLLPSKVFIGATVDTTLLFTRKETKTESFHESNVLIKLISKKTITNIIDKTEREFFMPTNTWHKINSFNIISNMDEINIINSIESKHDRLSKYADMFSGIKAYEVGKGNPPQTINVRDSKPYTSNVRKDESWLPFYDGKHVGRYQLLWKQNNWISYGAWLAAPRNPENFIEEKLLIRKIVGETLIATYIAETSYCNTLLFITKIKQPNQISYNYLLGILNSRFVGWYLKKKFQISPEDTFPQIMIRDIMQLAIPVIGTAQHDQMVSLVGRMLALNDQIAEAKTSHEQTLLQRQIEATDKQIDRLVYELYGLTEDEIKIVEGNGGS
jgi:type I restriction-modification system DNA methylase subunit